MNKLISVHKTGSTLKPTNVNPEPQPLPEVTWTPGSLTIEWDIQDLEIDWEGVGKPNISVEPHSVEIFLRNRPSIKITYVPDKELYVVEENA